MLIDFKDEDFENKIKSEDVSVIQFSAAWCKPCASLKPIMDKLAVEYKDKAGFYYAGFLCTIVRVVQSLNLISHRRL